MASNRDIGAQVAHTLSIAPQESDLSADINGASVDRLKALSAVIVCALGAASGSPTAQSFVFQLEESDDDSTFTAVADQTVEVTADDTSVSLDVDCSALKRYLRVTLDVSESSFTGGTSPANDCVAYIMIGGAQERPI